MSESKTAAEKALDRMLDGLEAAVVVGTKACDIAHKRQADVKLLRALLKERISSGPPWAFCPSNWSDSMGGEVSPACGECWLCRVKQAIKQTEYADADSKVPKEAS